MQRQKAVVPGYSASLPQRNHTNECAQERLKHYSKLVPLTEYLASIDHA